MSNVTQIALQGKLSIADTTINVVDGLYSLNDLHKASGGETKHQPSNFMHNDEIKALIAEIEHSSNLMNGNIYKAYKRIKGGLNQGLTSAVNWPIVMLCGLVLNLGRVIMPENTSMPFFVKALALTIGGIIALIVSGDIDLDGKIKITLGVILKFASSVGLGLYIGEFIWDYWDFYT